jgi:hypothetical protein
MSSSDGARRRSGEPAPETVVRAAAEEQRLLLAEMRRTIELLERAARGRRGGT